MPKYSNFQDNSIFADNFINQTIDKLMTTILTYFPESEDEIYVAGGVAKNMQDVINKPVKDLDLIIRDEKVFEFLKQLNRYGDFDTNYNKENNRVYVKAKDFYIEIWYNPKDIEVIKKYNINQKLYSLKNG